MDILRFVNSKDIREHLRNINYTFNSLEVAWLIYQCKTATIEEKHAAWQKLIETMPDCALQERIKRPPCERLHQFLKYYIETENAILNDLSISENAVYTYETLGEDQFGKDWWWPSNQYFRNHQDCIDDYITRFKLSDPPRQYCVQKHRLDNHEITRVTFSNTHQALSYDTSWYPGKHGDAILYEVFFSLWFEFPTPFKKGDILCEYKENGKEKSGYCRGPLVMTAVTPMGARKSTRMHGDKTDMNAWGYFQNRDGTIYHESMWNYMDLEYYRGELSGKRRILKALSNHIKGDIDVGLFANAYHHILCDEYTKAQSPRGYTDEGLRLAGLIE